MGALICIRIIKHRQTFVYFANVKFDETPFRGSRFLLMSAGKRLDRQMDGRIGGAILIAVPMGCKRHWTSTRNLTF
jgi:hypothetical protein